ncbi:hypothetical protein C9J01_18975 [Photobacterium rosenbergii]|uniref:Uncharacterized protein n=1 Tax=Photobacterium rosenbergii TaxID=294936 RepID=A0A2T3N9W7_9GAMM|nr:BamA/TamA family outer membrane protein [Photobacterium rosenbergii]PSW10295.1 hypothetical protein C9J01_18975 [Photobacterium rosenbergii]
MKKLLLTGLIASVFSGAVYADAIDDKKAEQEGVRFNTAIGPFYDPIFDFAGSVIPTLTYEIGDATKTSRTSLYGIYGSNGNWVAKVNTTNYLGSENQWKIFADATYTYAKLDVMNFMRFGQGLDAVQALSPDAAGFAGISDSPTVEVEQTTLRFEGDIGYQVIEDLYIGPSWIYVDTEFDRDSSAPEYGTINMITDKELTGYGIKVEYDKRSNPLTPLSGFYVSVNAQTIEVENTNGSVVGDLSAAADFLDGMGQQEAAAGLRGVQGMTLNGTDEYENVKADLRYYTPISDSTTFAWRGMANWNSEDAPTTLATLDSVATGFTMEIAGRSSYGTDFQLRHWLTNDIGIVGGVAFAKAQDVGTGGDDDIHYSGTVGFRYMLAPEDGLSMRLDITYNDQEEDNVLAFFNVGESF